MYCIEQHIRQLAAFTLPISPCMLSRFLMWFLMLLKRARLRFWLLGEDDGGGVEGIHRNQKRRNQNLLKAWLGGEEGKR